jgi:hypothetical protein
MEEEIYKGKDVAANPMRHRRSGRLADVYCANYIIVGACHRSAMVQVLGGSVSKKFL